MGNHMVMEPAKRGEIVRIVIAGFCPMLDVMRLKAVATSTPIDGATTVTPGHEPTGWRVVSPEPYRWSLRASRR